jgi:UDP-N-acetylmuramoyl-L-alanyl-D-glutamate--2,6-diaminopimelate ligase
MIRHASRLSALVSGAGIRPRGAIGSDPLVGNVTLDSRRVESGDMFFALPGLERDGMAFVPEALARGARAILAGAPRPSAVPTGIAWVHADEPRRAAALLSRELYGRPDEALSLVGVTGTNGKTTVTYLVESIGRAAGRRCGRIGTIGWAIDGREQPAERTTPEAPDFYRMLHEMREAGVGLVAAEVSSHALALLRVEGAHFAVAAFLNLSPEHLDFHGDEAAYFAAKARLFDSLEPGQWAVTSDSPRGLELAARTRGRSLVFGRSARAAVRLSDERCGLAGSSAVLAVPSGRLPLRTFLLGRANLDNVAAAAACAVALDLPPESIPAGVLALESVPGRMERIDCGQPFTVLVDYAHTAAALERALGWVREIARGRILAVFGCGGSRDPGKRPVMGRVAAQLADRVFLTSDNPRDEDPRRILEQIGEGVDAVGGRERCRVLVDRAEAIVEALAEARPGDIVLVAGKGHETTQVVGQLTRPFDDRRVVREALSGLGWNGGRRRAEA